MALCQGESLKQKIRRGPLSPDETLRLALQMAEGLAAAHARGIIHRDVKPANVLISEAGQVRLVDFGLAKLAGEARLTRPGVVMGTLSYMSPEQFTGGEIDARSDVWSLGVVMYEMLTGHLPFEADTEPACIYSIVHKKHRPIQSLPLDILRDLAAVVEKALAKDPEDRFPSAREMAAALRALMEGREGSFQSIRPLGRRAATWALLVILVATLTLLMVTGWHKRLGEYTGLARSSEGLHMVLLPLRDVSGSEDFQLMADGLSELLNRQLGLLAGQAKDSWIAPLNHVETYEVKEASDARRLLGANLVLSGSIRASGNLLTVVIDLVDTRTLRRFETVSKTDNLANVATWREDLALETGRAAGLGVGSDWRSSLARGGTTRPAAFMAYVRGLGYFSRDGLENAVKTIEALEETIKQDP
jgi:serine/threonine-protein kinase